MKKTAAIITMHCPLNYGAVMQTYAFQCYLESLGLDVKIIDYNPYYIIYDQSLMYVGDDNYRTSLIRQWAYRLYKAPHKLKRIKNFSKFKKEELHLTKRFESYDDIIKSCPQFDYYFCGSDQIWNVVSGAHKDPAYFLQWVEDKTKRFSYAASGNLPLSDEVLNITIPMINDLNGISMREKSTIDIIQPFVKKEITHVCDPVFLLDETEWRKLASKNKNRGKRGHYVLVYPMGNGGENVTQKGYELAQKLNLPLYKISSSQRKDKRVDKLLNVPPYEFLQMIIECDYFVTNSFHGTAFSIIFEKKFWSCVAEGSNQRLSSLLEVCGLSSRMISSEYIFENPYEEIDFVSAKKNLNVFVSQSKSYINGIVL